MRGSLHHDNATTERELTLDDFIRRFESQTLPKTEWTHAAHVRIGGCYVLAHGPATALQELRVGIRRLNESHGVVNSDTNGYHETLTCFWVAVIGRFLAEYQGAHPRTTRATLIEALVEHLGQRSALFEDYWTIDVARSVAARRHWVAPDKLPLDVAGLSLSGNDQHDIFG
jgi:hypothetical protein